MGGMACAYFFLISCLLFNVSAGRLHGASKDPSKLKQYPEAVPSAELEGAQKAVENQRAIAEELDKLVDSLRKESGMTGNLKGQRKGQITDGDFKLLADTDFADDADWVYESRLQSRHTAVIMTPVAPLYLMEAPVIYLTPPAILPNEQIDAGSEAELVLLKTGLEKEPKDVSKEDIDPYHMTSLPDVKTAIKSCKHEIEMLRKKRDELWKRVKTISPQLSTDRSRLFEYKSAKQELQLLNKKLDDEATRLTKLEHVKAALIKKTGKDVENEEKALEDRESELAQETVDSDQESEQFGDL